MPRGPSPVKSQQWTERLNRFEESQQTVAEFCRTEGVSEPAFYEWKRRLGRTPRTKTLRGPRRSKTATRPSPSFQSVRIRGQDSLFSDSLWDRTRGRPQGRRMDARHQPPRSRVEPRGITEGTAAW